MDAGDIGVVLGIALMAVGAWVGKVHGAKAGKKFERTVILLALGVFALVLAVGLSWSAIAGGGGGSRPASATPQTGAWDMTTTTRGCKRLAKTAQKFSAFLTRNDFDAEKLQADFGLFGFLAISPGAPREIRDDLQVLDDAYMKFLDALASVDPANFDQELRKKLSTAIDLQRVTQASQNVVAWAQKSCP